MTDIAGLPRIAPLSWSRYRLDRLSGEFRFVQDVGPPARLEVGDVGWTGNELIAFRVHPPSRISFHNSPLGIERGNILVWEQPLADRLVGKPVSIEARVDTESILYRTLWLFGVMIVVVVTLFAGLLWWIVRKGRTHPPAAAA